MGFFAPIGELFTLIGFLISSGGWVVLLFVGFYLLYEIFKYYTSSRFYASIKWVYLAIDVPKENEQTFLAVEQIFAQMHSMHVNHSFGEKLFEGRFVLWISFEIVSFGGQIKYIVRVPEKFRNLVETAIYAQYPQAEIKEVEDYLKNLPPYHPDTSYYDVWGTDFVLKKEDAIPIRTYRAFEHQASQIIVDPLGGVLEAVSAIQPHELMAYQIIVRPTDDKWKEKGYALVKELKGERKKPKQPGLFAGIMSAVIDGLVGILSPAGAEAPKKSANENEPPSMMLHLSPGERETIEAIEKNLGKIGYDTKVRLMYLAPKEKFRSDAKAALVGAFRQFDDVALNGLKPDTKRTWTGKQFKLYEPFERPYIEWVVNRRKQAIVRNFKSRNFYKGSGFFVLNIEELATVFHFPLLTVKAPQLTKTEIAKTEPPINLPVQY